MMLGNQSNSAPCARRPCVASPNHDKYHDLHPKWRPRNYTLLRARVRPQVPFGTNARVVAPLLPAAEATSFMGGRPQKSVAGPILCRQRSKMSGRTTASTGNWFFAPAPLFASSGIGCTTWLGGRFIPGPICVLYEQERYRSCIWVRRMLRDGAVSAHELARRVTRDPLHTRPGPRRCERAS